MEPRSPTHAFDPSPALEFNRNNYSPFNQSTAMISVERHFPNSSKEVRFASPPPNPFHRAHSIATENVPLLPQVSSASQLPKQSFRLTQPAPGIDIDAYIENCRNLNEQLRIAHETERRAWNIERSALKAKIADLEFKLNKSKDVKRRSSIESSPSNAHHSVRSDFRAMYNHVKNMKLDAGNSIPETAVHTTMSASPVWRAAENGTPTTRVFSHEDSSINHHLPSISEDGAFPSLSKQVSPTAHAPIESVPVPIESIEPTLDGITLKSTALASSFVTKITSPQFGSPMRSPPLKAKIDANGLHIETASLLHPLDEKLRRNAGHTPMNFDGADPSGNPSDQQPTEQTTPQPERPIAPVPTARPPFRPAEESGSYFSITSDSDTNDKSEEFPAINEELEEQYEPKDDRPLRGPLMLDSHAKSRAADDFLSSVDAKLMQAVKEVSPTRRESIFSENGDGVMVPATALQPVQQPKAQTIPEVKEPEDDMPRLKMKKSSNFGSAYGSSMPGRW